MPSCTQKLMKKLKLTLVLLLLIISASQAQVSIENEINQAVWKPFMESWASYDAVTYNSLHTDDVLRPGRNSLTVGQDYKDRNTRSFAASAERNGKRSIHFSFEQRVYSENRGYEVGYYKVIDQREGQAARTFYGRFHVVLRKENGQWKIAQDWDTNSLRGKPISQEDWDRATPLEF